MKIRHFRRKNDSSGAKVLNLKNTLELIDLENELSTKWNSNPLNVVDAETILEERKKVYYTDSIGFVYPKDLIDLYYDEVD